MSSSFEIGKFTLDPGSGVLTCDGKATALGVRAVSVLGALVEHAGEYVSKTQLLEAAWSGTVVEEGNLPVQIAAIRRVLSTRGGGGWIETLPRRGYRFVGPVRTRTNEAFVASAPPRSNVPAALSSFIGRERELVEIKRLLPSKRLVTIQGVGGIGKTRLALQLAAEVADAYRDGVWIAELGSIREQALVPATVAQVLGLEEKTSKPSTESLLAYLKSRQLLLVLDNCEHVIDACARLVDTVLREAKEATIIATSREPLRLSAEQSYVLQSLSLPYATSPDAIRNSEAVQLFVERVRQQLPDFELTPDREDTVAGICVHLDGIPLALELAAARARSLSVEQINARLSDRFRLLTSGSRTALPRQQTLRATLDWSYDLLAEDERVVLRRLSVFPGSFAVEAASAVASDERIDDYAAIDLVSQLVSRSLVIADTNAAGTRYRLLETVRAYALEKLEETGELGARRGRHAEFFRSLFEHELDDWLSLPDPEWRARYLSELTNVRAALDWALGPHGDAAIAVDLASASGSLWVTLGLFGEGAQRLQAAIALVGPKTPELTRARLWFWLSRCLAETPPQARAALEQAVELYSRLGHAIGLGLSLMRLARVLAQMGRFEQAEVRVAEARPLLEDSGRRALYNYHFHAAFLKNQMKDWAAARAHYERALELAREVRDDLGLLASTGNLAITKMGLGDLDGAIESTRELIGVIRTSPAGTRRLLGYALMNLAGLLGEKNELDASLAFAREGLPLLVADGGAWSFSGYGAVRAGREGKYAKAALLAGYADRVHAANDGKPSAFEAPIYGRMHALLREKLPAAELERLLAEGATLSEDEACRLALED